MAKDYIDKLCQIADDAVWDSTTPIERGTSEADTAFAVGVRKAIRAGVFGPCPRESVSYWVSLSKRHAHE